MRRLHGIVAVPALRTALFTARAHDWLRTAAAILDVPQSVSLPTKRFLEPTRSSRSTLLIARDDLRVGHLFSPGALELFVHVEFDHDHLAIASKLPAAHIRDQRG